MSVRIEDKSALFADKDKYKSVYTDNCWVTETDNFLCFHTIHLWRFLCITNFGKLKVGYKINTQIENTFAIEVKLLLVQIPVIWYY